MARLTLQVSPVVRVAYDGLELLRYVHLPDDAPGDSPRPYLHPVRSLAGEVVTLARPHDHPWHKGIAWSLPHVGPHNLWGGPTFSGGEYRRLRDHGSMDHQRFTEIRERSDHVVVAHELVWHGRSRTGLDAGPELVREQRRILVVVPAPDAWVLTFESTMTNVSGEDLPLGSPTTHGHPDAGYGGLFWRGPRSFTGGTVLTPEGAGAGDDASGRPAPWAGFTGRHDETGGASTVVLVDDGANPVHPPPWYARSVPFAALGPAPFLHEEMAFPHRSELSFRYAVVVGVGRADVASAADLAALGREALALAAQPAPPPTLGSFAPVAVPTPVEAAGAEPASTAALGSEADLPPVAEEADAGDAEPAKEAPPIEPADGGDEPAGAPAVRRGAPPNDEDTQEIPVVPPVDAARDTGADAASDTGADAASDTGADAEADGGAEADAGADAASDTGADAATLPPEGRWTPPPLPDEAAPGVVPAATAPGEIDWLAAAPPSSAPVPRPLWEPVKAWEQPPQEGSTFDDAVAASGEEETTATATDDAGRATPPAAPDPAPAAPDPAPAAPDPAPPAPDPAPPARRSWRDRR